MNIITTENITWLARAVEKIPDSSGMSISGHMQLKQHIIQGLDSRTIHQVNKNKQSLSYRKYKVETGKKIVGIINYPIELQILPPELISITQISSSAVNMQWIDKSTTETEFLVQISSDNQQTWSTAAAMITRTPLESTAVGEILTATVNILPGYNIYFRVVASNKMKSSISNILTLEIKKPNKVNKLNLYYVIANHGIRAKKVNMYIVEMFELQTEDDFYILAEDDSSIYI